MEENLQLGGHINLSGFNVIEKPEFMIIKKIVGSYARKFSDRLQDYESLDLHLKEVHKTSSSKKYELHAKLIHRGHLEVSEVIERNIFVALDVVLKKLEHLIS